MFIRRKRAEQIIEEVRGDDPEVASYRRIEVLGLEAGGATSVPDLPSSSTRIKRQPPTSVLGAVAEATRNSPPAYVGGSQQPVGHFHREGRGRLPRRDRPNAKGR